MLFKLHHLLIFTTLLLASCTGNADKQEKKTDKINIGDIKLLEKANPSALFSVKAGGGGDGRAYKCMKGGQLLHDANIIEEKALNLFFPINADLETEVGNQQHETIKGEYRFIEDSRTKQLRGILAKLVKNIERHDIQYQLYFVDADNVINAFTIPGGNIYIFTGIYNFANNQDELANIIGHEISHNECYHCKKFIQRNITKGALGNKVGAIMNLLGKATMGFNQVQELEADLNGYDLIAKAGFDPKLGIEFWKRMSENESKKKVEGLFRSHPWSATRYDCGIEYIDVNIERR